MMLALNPYFAFGLASLCIGLAWGARALPPTRWLGAAALIGLSDALATFAASGAPASAPVYAGFVALLGALALLHPAWFRLLLLSLALSIDNWLLPHAPLDPVLAGLSSFALAALGFCAAALALQFTPSRARCALACALALPSLAFVALS